MSSIILPAKDFGLHEECGIVGIIGNKTSDVARDMFFGLFALQHRGQESAGIAVGYDNNKIAYYKNMGLVNEVFGEEELSLLPSSRVGVGHVRYSTTGSSNVVNAQPVVFHGRHGRMALAHNGNVVNAEEIKSRLIRRGHIFQSSIDSEVISALVNYFGDKSLEEGVIKACEIMQGAFSFVIMAGNKLIAARDRHGFRPLIIGKKDDKYVFVSESCALDAMDAKIYRDVKPGEIVICDTDGNMRSEFLSSIDKKTCIFEYVYLARSDSVIDNVSVYEARYECGKHLAKLFKIDADIVAGVPDSALVCAKGYSDSSGIPMVDALTKNRYVGRTFIQPNQSMRESSVKIKLSAFRHNIAGKRLILIDDSIVRGTTSKKIIQLLRNSGAKEVHMLLASPIVKYPCFFGVDMQTKEQLIGSNRSEDEICKIIGADSLHYIPLECLRTACGDKCEFCAACFDGKYPDVVEENYCNKFILE